VDEPERGPFIHKTLGAWKIHPHASFLFPSPLPPASICRRPADLALPSAPIPFTTALILHSRLQPRELRLLMLGRHVHPSAPL
jgi:hypothetical protein